MRTSHATRAWIIREAVELVLLIGVLVGVSQFLLVPWWAFFCVALAKAVVSALMYRFFLRKVFLGPIRVGPERLVGQIAQTITPLDPSGQIKAGGEIWTATSDTGRMIPARQKVRILKVRGTTIQVEPMQ